MYRLKDLMTMFQIPERTIRRHLSDKILTGSKVGGVWRFTEEDLHAYLDQPSMKQIKAKNRLGFLLDFLNGFKMGDDTCVVLLAKQDHDKRHNSLFSLFVSSFEHPFQFDLSKSGGRTILSFMGHTDDAKALMDYVNHPSA
jgi:excisionase family DNA binding protein